jgi:hypothetical protein
VTPRPAFDRGQIARLRLQALGLAGEEPVARDPLGVVEHHLAMQAQDFRASRWAVGSRLPEATDTAVLDAYDGGAIVRSWPMRGTVHVVASRDLPWMLELMGHRALSGVASRWAVLGIDEPFLERARDVALALLSGGNRCTRAELNAALTEAGLDMTGQRAYHTVWYLSQTGTLVQGPTEGGEQLLVLMNEWIPEPRTLDRDEALAELGMRYMIARGPVTVDDLVHWTKLTKSDCRTAFDANGAAVVQVDGPGGPFHMLAQHLDTLDPESPAANRSVLALAAFDEHLLGYRVRDAVLDPEFATRVDPGRNGVFRWTLVVGGEVVATWKRTRRSRYTLVEISPFRSLPVRIRRAAEDALGRWATFVNTTLQVRWADAA